jgi:outer membrane protein TolC
MTDSMNARAIALGILLAASGCAEPDRPALPPPGPERRAEPAPSPPPRMEGPLDLRRAIDEGARHVPALRTARARADAAAAGIDLADTAWLPRIDLLWQEIRATRNNISGTTFPQGVIPAISGPVSRSRSWDSGWGSNAGALLTYEPVDFGLRSANAEVARLGARQAEADVRVAALDAAAGAAEAFLATLAALQAQKTARANLDRWDAFSRAVHALADRDLRPGVDASRADAEVAAARNQLIIAEQTVATGRLTLAEAMGMSEAPPELDPGPLLDRIPEPRDLPDPTAHPLLTRQAAAVETAQARAAVYDKAYVPKVGLLLSANARGSGFDAAGNLDADDGLYPTRPNWAAGIQFSFSPLDYYSIQARQLGEAGAARAEQARADEIHLALKMQNARIRAVADAARKIAANTPVQLKAARDAHTQARVRYDSGLGTLTEVAEGQRLLSQAEIDDALARLSVWRVLASAARIQGDYEPFLQLVASLRGPPK